MITCCMFFIDILVDIVIARRNKIKLTLAKEKWSKWESNSVSQVKFSGFR